MVNGAGVDKLRAHVAGLAGSDHLPVRPVPSAMSAIASSSAMGILFITSLLPALSPSTMALPATYVAGREGLLPKSVGVTHPVFQSPHVGSVVADGYRRARRWPLCLYRAGSGAGAVLLAHQCRYAGDHPALMALHRLSPSLLSSAAIPDSRTTIPVTTKVLSGGLPDLSFGARDLHSDRTSAAGRCGRRSCADFLPGLVVVAADHRPSSAPLSLKAVGLPARFAGSASGREAWLSQIQWRASAPFFIF